MQLQEKHHLTFDLGVKVIHSIAKHPLHHVTFATAKFEVAMPSGFGGGELQEM